MIKLALVIEGLEDTDKLIGLSDEQINRAAARAINYASDRARTSGAKEIRKQVSFPAAYLTPSQGRLSVARKASEQSLEGVITARHRATSLARFVVNGTPGKTGVQVQVKPGKTEQLARAFLIRLRSGNADIDTASNLGLAVRTNRGEKPSKAYRPVQIAENLFLVYGPSVSQVFKTVREDIEPAAQADLADEFFRQIELERRK